MYICSKKVHFKRLYSPPPPFFPEASRKEFCVCVCVLFLTKTTIKRAFFLRFPPPLHRFYRKSPAEKSPRFCYTQVKHLLLLLFFTILHTSIFPSAKKQTLRNNNSATSYNGNIDPAENRPPSYAYSNVTEPLKMSSPTTFRENTSRLVIDIGNMRKP